MGSRPTVNNPAGSIASPVNGWGYRPQLDGLRAVAVYLVVLFHSGSQRFRGGFVGVDLFFVLSGLLVTNVLLADAARGDIRFWRFYARRARRLIPAASAAIVGVSLTAMLVSSRLDRLNIVPDARAASLWYANWHFITAANDYFAEGGLESPLLHFWSLAVEEQFYLFFPLVLFGVIRISRGRLKLVAVAFSILLVAGAALQFWWAGTDPNRAYMGTDARVYQPLAGVLLAVVLWRVGLSRRWRTMGDVLFGAAIVGLVALSTLVPDWSSSTRGVAAAAVAALAIFASELSPHGWVGRALSLKPVRYLGAISYGTYLWHWPVVAFGHRLLDWSPRAMFVCSAVVGTAMAALSFEVLEQPVRTATWLRSRSITSVTLGVGTAAMVGLVVAPYFLHRTAPAQVRPLATPSLVEFSTRTPVPDLDWAAVKDDFMSERGCVEPDASDCLLRTGAGQTVFVAGDSHAKMWAPTILALAERYDWTVYLGFSPGCVWPNGIYINRGKKIDIEKCRERRPVTYEQIDAVDPDLVVLSERGLNERRLSGLAADNDAYAGLSPQELVARSMTDSIAALTDASGRGVLLVEPVPEVTIDPVECLSGAEFIEECAFPAKNQAAEEDTYRELAASSPQVVSVDVDARICGEICFPMIDDVVVRRDANHLTISYARLFVDEFDAAIQQVTRQRTG